MGIPPGFSGANLPQNFSRHSLHYVFVFCMKKSETAALAKTYVSMGFDHGYRSASAVIEICAAVLPDEQDKELLAHLAELLKKQATSEKKVFFSEVKFEAEEDGLVVMKKK
jgi:hypothetical protein